MYNGLSESRIHLRVHKPRVFVCSEGNPKMYYLEDNSHSEKRGSEFVGKPFCQCYDVSIDRSSTCCEVVA